MSAYKQGEKSGVDMCGNGCRIIGAVRMRSSAAVSSARMLVSSHRLPGVHDEIGRAKPSRCWRAARVRLASEPVIAGRFFGPGDMVDGNDSGGGDGAGGNSASSGGSDGGSDGDAASPLDRRVVCIK